MLDLGTLKIGIEVDDGSAKEGLQNVDNEVEQTASGINSKFSSIGKKIGKAFKAAAVASAAAMVKIGKDAFQAYGSYEQLKGGVETLFGTASDTVMKNAQKAYKTAGISANQYMEQATSFSASLLQSLGGDTQKAAKVADMAIIDMSDNANKMGTSIESIQNAYQGFAKQNYTMLDNLKLGYGGTKQEMERLLEDAGKLTGKKYDINNLNDVYEAIHAIQVEQGIAGTTAKEASTTIEGSINMAKASWQNFLVALGTGNKKTIDKAMSQLGESIKTALKNIIPVARDIFISMMTQIGEAVGISSGTMTKALNTICDAIEGAFTWFINHKDIIIAGLTGIAAGFLAFKVGLIIEKIIGFVKTFTTVQAACNAVMAANPVMLIAMAIAALIAGIVLLIKNWDKVKKAFKKPLKAIVNSKAVQKAKEIIGKAKEAWGNFKAKAKEIALKVKDKAVSLAHKAVGGLKKGWELAKSGAKKAATYAAKYPTIALAIAALKKLKQLWEKIKNMKAVKNFSINLKANLAGLGKKVRKLLGLRRGLREVPYDGLQAELHKGERVLTAAEANQYDDVMRKYNNRFDGATSTQMIAAGIDYNQLANTLVSALSGMNMTTAVNVDGRTIAQATAPFMKTAINTLDRRANRKLGVV